MKYRPFYFSRIEFAENRTKRGVMFDKSSGWLWPNGDVYVNLNFDGFCEYFNNNTLSLGSGNPFAEHSAILS